MKKKLDDLTAPLANNEINLLHFYSDLEVSLYDDQYNVFFSPFRNNI